MRRVSSKTDAYIVIADGKSALAKSDANFVGDTDAVFTQALDYLDTICADSNVECATLFVREGTYTFSNQIDITSGRTNLQSKHIKIVGANHNVKIVSDGTAMVDTDMLVLSTLGSCEISNLTFDADSATHTVPYHGLIDIQDDNIVIKNCRFIGIDNSYYSVYINQGAAASKIKIIDNEFFSPDGVANPTCIYGIGTLDDSIIARNRTTYSTTGTFYQFWANTQQITNTIISDNICPNLDFYFTWNGDGFEDVTFMKNSLKLNDSDAPGAIFIKPDGAVNGLKVVENTLMDSSYGPLFWFSDDSTHEATRVWQNIDISNNVGKDIVGPFIRFRSRIAQNPSSHTMESVSIKNNNVSCSEQGILIEIGGEHAGDDAIYEQFDINANHIVVTGSGYDGIDIDISSMGDATFKNSVVKNNTIVIEGTTGSGISVSFNEAPVYEGYSADINANNQVGLSYATWTVNEWTNGQVFFITGVEAGNSYSISSNTADTITFAGGGADPGPGCDFWLINAAGELFWYNSEISGNNIILENTGFIGDGITVECRTYAGATDFDIYDITIKDNKIKTYGTSGSGNGIAFNILIEEALEIDRLNILNNECYINAGRGILITQGNHPLTGGNANHTNDNMHIKGNIVTIESNSYDGIYYYLQNASTNTITNSKFCNNEIMIDNRYGIRLRDVITDCIISGNKVSSATANGGTAIYLNNASMDYVSIDNNSCGRISVGLDVVSGVDNLEILSNSFGLAADYEYRYNSTTLTEGNKPTTCLFRPVQGPINVTVATGEDDNIIHRGDFMDADPYISWQAAIDFIEANSTEGGKVYIKPGSYVFTTNNSITITNNSIVLEGAGWNTKLKRDLVGTNTHAVDAIIVNGEGCAIRNIEFDYNTNTNSGNMIELAGVTTTAGCVIENIRIVGGTSSGQLYINGGSYCQLRNSSFKSSAAGYVLVVWQGVGSHNIMQNNIVESGNFTYIAEASGSNSLFDKNKIYGSINYFIYGGNNDLTITNNRIYATMQNSVIRLTKDSADTLTVSNNVVNDCNGKLFLEVLTNATGALTLSNLTISGNHIESGRLVQFTLYASDNNSKAFNNINITDNNVISSGGDCIKISLTGATQDANYDFSNLSIENNLLDISDNYYAINIYSSRTNTSAACTTDFSGTAIQNNSIISAASGKDAINIEFSDNCTATQLDVTLKNLAIENNSISLSNAGALDAIKFNFNCNANLNSLNLDNLSILNNEIDNAGDGGIDITIGSGEPLIANKVNISHNIIDCNAGECILWSSGQTGNTVNNVKINDNILKPQLAESVEYGIQWYDNCERLEVCRNTYEGQFVGLWISASDSGSNVTEIYDLKVCDNTVECLANTLGNPGIMIQTGSGGACDRVQCCGNKVRMTTTATGVYQKGIQFGEIASAGDFEDVQINNNQIHIVDTGGATGRVHKPLYIAGDLVGYQINNNYIYLSATHADVDVYGISVENPDAATEKGTIVGNNIIFSMASPDLEVGIYLGGAATDLATSIQANSITLDDGTARYGVQWAAAHTGFSSFPNYINNATQQYWYNGTNGPPAAGATFAGCWWFEDGAGGSRDRIHMCMESAAGAWSWVELANGGA